MHSGRPPQSRRWLVGRWNPEKASGFEHADNPRWALGLRYYNAAAGAAALSGADAARTSELAASLLAQQHPDGGRSNAESVVKEDDPLIATGFALSALAVAARES